MHFSYFTLGTLFSLQQIKRSVMFTLKLSASKAPLKDLKSSLTVSEYSLHIMIPYFTRKVGSK